MIWLWRNYKFSPSEKITFFGCLPLNLFFFSFIPFLSLSPLLVSAYFFPFISFLNLLFLCFGHFRTTGSYQPWHHIPFFSVPSLHLPFILVNIARRQTVTQLYSHKLKSLLVSHLVVSKFLNETAFWRQNLNRALWTTDINFMHSDP
jgi:hypothetical protein